ncbi:MULTISPECIES: lysophospholipid acyltransferase family protein [Methylosinus]|uniref:1-acyl-sn-glycerol-3-phosphate acyltransferase n=1 Tax=Methylosinus trichosporium (strain ATCC 35070 / NCIMB 11131 / UNIQEM 75 / OB3b) TaxID=595536 RepID=A0A2D2CVY3_METT3|nr:MULTISPECIES: lysophospholipid acyltransferase family protein [Methylosinus]ATQ66799.1 1-acyl-sn-glycerol-3-phosphate acyltransferase [Methylosinus trichosporium OB3b]OBS54182.1 acyl-phosphate glycerol 3-phosphate acyltransferase [Methylosinus sp. 3S-1]
MLYLRSLIFNIAFFTNVIVLMLIWLPALAMPRQASLTLGRAWGRTSLWWLEKIVGLKVEFRGLENIPKGPVIVACKHQSIWETFVLPLHFPDFSFILKHELIYIPFFGWYLLAAEQIAVDRAKGGRVLPQITRKVKALFAQGRQLFIFPEGTRRPIGAPAQYKFGVAHLYHESGAACLPVALNSGLFWPRRSFLIRPGTVVLEYLPPIEPGLAPRLFFERLQETMETATERLIEEAVARDPALGAIVERNRATAPTV